MEDESAYVCIRVNEGRPNRQLASDMGCDRGNLTRRPLPACAWCAPPVNLIKIKATSLVLYHKMESIIGPLKSLRLPKRGFYHGKRLF